LLRGPAKRGSQSKLPFLEGKQRLAARAVNGALLAFIGAKRRPLTEEAGGLGAGFGKEGQNPKA